MLDGMVDVNFVDSLKYVILVNGWCFILLKGFVLIFYRVILYLIVFWLFFILVIISIFIRFLDV